jgi:hypothetical protein
MLVLQTCTDPLHILPGSSSETFPTPSDGACNSSSREFEENIDAKEEGFVAVNEEALTGIKEEEIPEEECFPHIKPESNEVSYVCVCLLLDTFYHCSEMLFFFVTSVFLDNSNSCTVGIENGFYWGGGWGGLHWMGWSVCNCREDENISSFLCS